MYQRSRFKIYLLFFALNYHFIRELVESLAMSTHINPFMLQITYVMCICGFGTTMLAWALIFKKSKVDCFSDVSKLDNLVVVSIWQVNKVKRAGFASFDSSHTLFK